MAGRIIPQPQFPADEGGADPRLGAVLDAYAAGRVGEHAVIAELIGARLLVPVVAVLSQDTPPGEDTPLGDGQWAALGERSQESRKSRQTREKESEMALPTLVGADGRRGLLGFTSLETLAMWRPDARPVAVYSQQACQAVLDENADALVIDVAGPVPFAVDGYRLRLFAEGRPIPLPHEDPDVLAAIEAAFGTEQGVTGIRVGAGNTTELSVRFTLTGDADERATVQRVADRLTELLRGRIVGGVELGVVRGL